MFVISTLGTVCTLSVMRLLLGGTTESVIHELFFILKGFSTYPQEAGIKGTLYSIQLNLQINRLETFLNINPSIL